MIKSRPLTFTNLAVLFLVLLTNYGHAQNFTFKFAYGVGSLPKSEALLFYELVPASGVPEKGGYLSIKDKHVEKIHVKRNTYKEIRFSGYFISEDKSTRRNVLLASRQLESLERSRGEENLIAIVGAESVETGITPLPELLNQLSLARYNELLKKTTNNLAAYSFSNVRPIGRFITYNKTDKTVNDALVMPKDKPLFVELSKGIVDHYILKKKMGFNFSINYAKLAGVSTENEKNQYIEYMVKVDSLQVQHWQSETSEMEFLYTEAKSGRLDYLKDHLLKNEIDFYFLSSCVKITNFNLEYYTHDSVGSVSSLNLDIPVNAANLSVRGGVVYARKEGIVQTDKTPIYYTSFGIRDYTTYLRDIFKNLDLNTKIHEAKDKVKANETKVCAHFADLRAADATLTSFSTPEMIVSFVSLLSFKEPLGKTVTMITEELSKVDAFNATVLAYNASLKTIRNTITDYNDSKSYLASLEGSKTDASLKVPVPTVKPINDSILLPLFKSKSVSMSNH